MKNRLIIKAIVPMLMVAGIAVPDALARKSDFNEGEKTRIENLRMATERDDFLTGMPEGKQAQQRQAITRALRGDNSDLMAVRNGRNTAAPLSPLVEHRDLAVSGDNPLVPPVRGRLYLPKKLKDGDGARYPLLVYFHGGGWTIGSIESCAAFCDSLAAKGDVAVLAVDYRLAPENPFPAAIDDCVMATEYALAHASEWGCDPARVSVGGDSSGGNLALCTALAEKDYAAPLKSVVAIYPVTKAYADKSASWRQFGGCYGLDSDLMEAFNDAYFAGLEGDERAKAVTLASPDDYPDVALKRLPPVMLIAAGNDILRDQGKEFTARLSALGVDASRVEFPEATHLFITVPGQPTAFARSVSLVSDFLGGR